MECVNLEDYLHKFNELKRVVEAIKTIGAEDIRVTLDYTDRSLQGKHREEFTPSKKAVMFFLSAYRHKLIQELKDAGLEVPDECFEPE